MGARKGSERVHLGSRNFQGGFPTSKNDPQLLSCQLESKGRNFLLVDAKFMQPFDVEKQDTVLFVKKCNNKTLRIKQQRKSFERYDTGLLLFLDWYY